MDASIGAGAWFNGWESIGRVVLAGVAACAALILMLRLSGKRTSGAQTTRVKGT